jgi:hypothetical protein
LLRTANINNLVGTTCRKSVIPCYNLFADPFHVYKQLEDGRDRGRWMDGQCKTISKLLTVDMTREGKQLNGGQSRVCFTLGLKPRLHYTGLLSIPD